MSAQAPNLGSIANDLQSISRSFAGLCLELGKLENLPSVDLLTQLKSLNDSIAVKEEMMKVAGSVKAAEEKLDKRLDELFADVKAVKNSVELLQNRLGAVEKVQTAQKAAQTAIDAHFSAVENNCYARQKNRSKSSGGYYCNQTLVGFRSDDNRAITDFPADTFGFDWLNITVVDSILRALKLNVTGEERQRRDTLKGWIGRG
ncbi:hypothetical protein DFP73DRAFT_582126 [Morchella snyderi]|nr:hypothetical protein DFP73DRAFT_582126 [Morchella snyderi]